MVPETLKNAVNSSSFKEKSSLLKFIGKINWQNMDRDGEAEASWSGNTIYVYRNSNDPEILLREVGRVIYHHPKLKKKWDDKLAVVTKTQLEVVQYKIREGNYESYADMVKSFDAPVTRLVALHIGNGLLASGTPITAAKSIDLGSWGTTTEFAAGKKPYSLIPLTSAYCPRKVHEDFGEALASCVLSQLRVVRHTEVRASLTELIEEMVKEGFLLN